LGLSAPCAKITGLPTLSDFPAPFLLVFGVAFGLAWGSFLNVVIHRLPRDQSVVSPPSHCPGCGAPIRALDNIPVLGFLWLRGKARCCGTKISPRYPAVELLGGLLAAAVLQLVIFELPGETSILAVTGSFFAYLSLGLALIAVAFIDLEYMLVPYSLTFGPALLGLLTAGLRGQGYADSLLGAAIGFAMIYVPFVLLYGLVRGHPGMGLGDAHLTLLAGAWFGWKGAAFALFAGAVQAMLVVVVVFVLRGRIEEPEAVIREREELKEAIQAAEGEARAELERERDLDLMMQEPEEGLGRARLPFGPFLALATLEYLLFGRAILEGYLSSWPLLT
jgi:leader peptidase (prepilin peptidase)/N-methyltransferase